MVPAGIVLTGSGDELRRHQSIRAKTSSSKELLPAALGALVGLLLIRPEARLFHPEISHRAGRGKGPLDDTLEAIGRPRVRQRIVWFDCQDLTVDSAPVRTKFEKVAYNGLEVVLHQPLLDQVRCVSARQVFSGPCGISRSIVTESVSVAGLLICPSF
jgi:hypothetical protein